MYYAYVECDDAVAGETTRVGFFRIEIGAAAVALRRRKNCFESAQKENVRPAVPSALAGMVFTPFVITLMP